MRRIIILTGFLLYMAIVQSCSKGSIPESKSESGIGIKLTRSLFEPAPDDRISGLRIMAFDFDSKILKSNAYYTSAQLSAVMTHQMNAGTYNFYMIANEPASLSNALNNVIQESDLGAINIPESSISSLLDIPMLFQRSHITVLPDNGGVIDAGTAYTQWPISFERLAIRFDIVLRAPSDFSSYFTGFSFDNIPDFVPVVGSYAGTHATKRTYLLSNPADAQYFRDTTVAGFPWAKKIQRVILPSNIFLPVNQYERILKFNVLTNTTFNPSCTFGIDEAQADYTMPNNRNLIVTATLKYPLEVYIDAQPWDTQNINGNIDKTNNYLNLATIETALNENEVKSMFFWTNRKGVFVELIGYMGAYGDTQFNVNDVFQDLAGIGAANLIYDAPSSEGRLNLSYIPGTLPQGSTKLQIIINAGGLRKALAITVTVP